MLLSCGSSFSQCRDLVLRENVSTANSPKKTKSVRNNNKKELLVLSFTTQLIRSSRETWVFLPKFLTTKLQKKPQTCISLKKQHILNCKAVLENCLLLPKTNQSLYIIKQSAIIFKEILLPNHCLLFSGLSLCTKIVITLLTIVKIGNSTLNTH